MLPDELAHSGNLGIAINDFFEMYHPGSMEPNEIQKEYIQRCKAIETGECYESIVLLLSHVKASRAREEKLEALGVLGGIIARVRAILEELHALTAGQLPSPAPKQNPRDFYGNHCYKCSRHLCYYFHEGFFEWESSSRAYQSARETILLHRNWLHKNVHRMEHGEGIEKAHEPIPSGPRGLCLEIPSREEASYDVSLQTLHEAVY